MPMKKAYKKRKTKKTYKPKSKKATVALIKTVINREAETKYRTYYSGGATGVTDPGLRAGFNWVPQNQFINSNITDIHRLIPPISQGIGDDNRIGTKISTQSLRVDGAVCISSNRMTPNLWSDYYAVIYVLQHVTLKDYTSLAAQNQFSQMLETGEQDTQSFSGVPVDVNLPVSRQFYRLLKKKVIPLKYAATTLAAPPQGMPNSGSYIGQFKFNLTKHVPKTLMYQEANTAPADPTNSSIFMSVGFTNMASAYGLGTGIVTGIDFQYVSHFHYKDM